MRNNSFVFVVTGHNCSDWLQKNLDSIVNQSYPYWRVIYIDDCSTDDSFQVVYNYIYIYGLNNKFTLLSNKQKVGRAFSKYRGYNLCRDDEIIVTLDADCWLYGSNVLNYLNEIYNNEKLLVTYGGEVEYQYGEERVVSEVRDFTPLSKANKFYRKEEWNISGLYTFYAHLVKNIDLVDLLNKDGDFIQCVDDMPFMYCVLEQSMGACRLIDEKLLYIKNKESAYEIYEDLVLQKSIVNRIQEIKPYITARNRYGEIYIAKFDDIDWFDQVTTFKNMGVKYLLTYVEDIDINLNLPKYKSVLTLPEKEEGEGEGEGKGEGEDREEGRDVEKVEGKGVAEVREETAEQNLFDPKRLQSLGLGLEEIKTEVVDVKNNLNFYFPHILLINLKRRDDRLLSIKRRLKLFDIEFEIIEGIDGQDFLIKEQFNLIRQYTRIQSVTEYASLLSHIKALTYARKMGYSSVLVLEDDLYLHKRFEERLLDLDTVPTGWDLLYMGCFQNREAVNLDMININRYMAKGSGGSFAYAVHSTVYDLLIKRIEKRVDNIEIELLKLQEEKTGYVMYENLMICEVDDSDVKEAKDIIDVAKYYGWNLNNYLLSDQHKEVNMLLIAREIDIITNMCMRSFIKLGYKVNLYTYVQVNDLPMGAVLKNAEKIVSLHSIQGMDISKVKALFAFSLLYKRGGLYVNNDVLAIEPIQWKQRLLVRNYTGDLSTKIIASVSGDLLIKNLMELERKGIDNKVQLIKEFNLMHHMRSFNRYHSIYPTDVDKLLFSNDVNVDLIEKDVSSICLWTDHWKQFNIVKGGYIHQMISKLFRISAYTVVTEPFATGYPIVECVKSTLPLVDQYTIIYGRDEKESREKLESLSNKVNCIVTNKWEKRWHYSAMTYHMHMGLFSCDGDLIIKMDSDMAFKLESAEDIMKYRMELFSHLLTGHLIYLPRINYLANGYFWLIEKGGVYCINRYLLRKDAIPYRIDVENYCNKLIIDGDHNIDMIENNEFAVFNYDCSVMNWDQLIEKQRAWFTAYYIFAGSLDHFKISMDVVNNDHKLYRFVIDRLIKRVKWAKKKGVLFKYGKQFNPKAMKTVLDNLDEKCYGYDYFGSEELSNLLVN